MSVIQIRYYISNHKVKQLIMQTTCTLNVYGARFVYGAYFPIKIYLFNILILYYANLAETVSNIHSKHPLKITQTGISLESRSILSVTVCSMSGNEFMITQWKLLHCRVLKSA